MLNVSYRPATEADLEFIVRLVMDDLATALPKDAAPPGDARYAEAFRIVAADPNQNLIIAEREGRRVGTLHLTFLPGLGLRGIWRGLVEAVHIIPEERGKGLGGDMMRWAIARCRARGCHMVQLTSNKARKDAHRFYLALGFEMSHEGFKLHL